VFTFFRGNFISFMGDLPAGRALSEEGQRVLREQGATELTIWADVHLEHHGSGLMGEVDPKMTHAKRGVDTAERLGSAWSLAFSYAFLGHAHLRNGGYAEAAAACEHARQISVERQAALEFLPYTLAFLAEAKAGLGEDEEAIATARQAVEFADGVGLALLDAPARLALARVLRRCSGGPAADEIAETLERALAVAHESGNRAEEPLIHVELAELALLRGDQPGWEREMRVAEEQFRANGAGGHLARVERLLVS